MATRISAILISRLMLNLRDPELTDSTKILLRSFSRTNIVFAMQPIDAEFGLALEQCRYYSHDRTNEM